LISPLTVLLGGSRLFIAGFKDVPDAAKKPQQLSAATAGWAITPLGKDKVLKTGLEHEQRQ